MFESKCWKSRSTSKKVFVKFVKQAWKFVKKTLNLKYYSYCKSEVKQLLWIYKQRSFLKLPIKMKLIRKKLFNKHILVNECFCQTRLLSIYNQKLNFEKFWYKKLSIRNTKIYYKSFITTHQGNTYKNLTSKDYIIYFSERSCQFTINF